MFPLGPKQWEFTLAVPLDVLWLRPIRVSAAELESNRVAERLVQDGLNIVRDIRVAYIDWQLAIERARLAEQGAWLRGDVARIAEARLDAGDVAELDVSAIRLDALVGTSEAASAARDAELALERLRYLLGLQLSGIAIEPAPMPELQLQRERESDAQTRCAIAELERSVGRRLLHSSTDLEILPVRELELGEDTP